MMEAAKRANMNMASLFEMIDSRGNGIISRENFEDVFFKLNLTVDQRTLESFIDNFWKENKAGIDYKQFLNIFKRYEVRMEDEEKAARSGTHTTPENIIRLKKAVFD
jgi:Ca2+-binding EF-hand superfamily protein